MVPDGGEKGVIGPATSALGEKETSEDSGAKRESPLAVSPISENLAIYYTRNDISRS